MPKFEIRVSDRADDWRETRDEAVMQSSSDAIQGSASLQSVIDCMDQAPPEPAALQSVIDCMSQTPPAALQPVLGAEPSKLTALQSVIEL